MKQFHVSSLTDELLTEDRQVYDPVALIDYRALLGKYVDYVGDEEGVDFINGRERDERFSDEEWAELTCIAEEACK